jgi:hypothetical protein
LFWPKLVEVDLRLSKNTTASKQQTPITLKLTPTPIPTLAPLLIPPAVVVTGVDWIGVDWLAAVEDNGVTVVPAEEAVIVVKIDVLEDVLVEEDELAKFQPFICTPCITDTVPVMVIVVGTHDPSVELRGVMT